MDILPLTEGNSGYSKIFKDNIITYAANEISVIFKIIACYACIKAYIMPRSIKVRTWRNW
ncbi:MAG: hypothetical protein CTY16_04725 [Methylobacter sp.]|nr:MAG: hypothetical protein CTY16_04725 [Methylobacter sp.]